MVITIYQNELKNNLLSHNVCAILYQLHMLHVLQLHLCGNFFMQEAAYQVLM